MPWYYVKDGQQAGPVSEGEFEALVASGRISPDTLVWKEGMDNWMPWSQVRATAMATAGQSSPAGLDQPQDFGGADSSFGAAGSPSGTVQCHECGRFYSEGEVIRYGTINVCAACKPGFVQRLREGGRASVGVMEYAGFWIRFLARFVDGLITGVVFWGVMLASGFSFDPSTWVGGTPNFGFFGYVFAMLLPFLYEAVMLARYGQTLGKMVVRVKIVNADGSAMSIRQVLSRCAWMHWITVIPIIGSLVLLIGCLMAAFDDEKRALHDRILNTRVVRI